MRRAQALRLLAFRHDVLRPDPTAQARREALLRAIDRLASRDENPALRSPGRLYSRLGLLARPLS